MAKSLRGCDEWDLIRTGIRGKNLYLESRAGHDMVLSSDDTGARQQQDVR